MIVFSSLRSRVFLTSALLAVLSIAAAIYVVNVRVARETELQLHREARETAAIVENLRATRVEMFAVHARLIADLPKLISAVDTDDPPTVADIAQDYRRQLNASVVVVTNARGRVLADLGATPQTAAAVAAQPAIRDALAGRESRSVIPEPNGILQVVTVPVEALARNVPHRDIRGSLSVGFLLDDGLAAQLKQITGSEVAFGMDGQVLASTLDRRFRPLLAGLLRSGGISRVRLGGDEYVALPQPLTPGRDGTAASPGPVALILRSGTDQVRFLSAIHTALGVTAILAVAVATVLSFAVARTITRPLAAITTVMRDVAATGDLTRKIVVGSESGWADADARLLASTFNTLTESIARFQREMAQRERLSSLGRMSTVVAHEVRNPLMIIKAALHSLRRPGLSADAMREAIADIDGEVARLNRIVNEVLDFARPIRFELTRFDLNTLCREWAAAAAAGDAGPAVTFDLDDALPPVTLDADRLRQVLVNLIVNARQAVEAVAAAPAAGIAPPFAGVHVSTRRHDGRVILAVADRGNGIPAADLPRVFDPYFTTKRGGSGLGLAIAKNIVEGLGGTIAVASTPGAGTEIRIELPIDAGVQLT